MDSQIYTIKTEHPPLDDMVKQLRQGNITELAKQLFINSLSIPHPEGTLNGVYIDGDYVEDEDGLWIKHPQRGWLNSYSIAHKENHREDWRRNVITKDLPFPKWHRDEYGPQRRLIRECYHQAELFFSTVEKLQE